MKLARFQRLAEAYGAEIERWPSSERDAARALLDESTEAKRFLDDARTLDAWLDAAAEDFGDADIERVWSGIRQKTRSTAPVPATLWMRLRPHAPATAFLASMWAIGLIVGNWTALDVSRSQSASSGFGAFVESSFYSKPYLISWNE